MTKKLILVVSMSAIIFTLSNPIKAMAENAAAMAPAGGEYQAVSELVELPDHIPGLGSLYVNPATLPAGPFAAYDKTGKLVSTIYMVPLEDMTAEKEFGSLDVAGGKVESVDLHYNAGHPGVEQPHYHIVLWHVDPASADLD